MGRAPATAKDGGPVRVGRPPRALAGEVDDRILEAARRVFLRRGISGASIDEIARLARAGKPTIYARFPTKQALFEAVAMRNAAHVRSGFERVAPTGDTVEARLSNLAADILKRLLVRDAIDFMRLSLGELRRFPRLAGVGGQARARAVEAVSRLLAELAQSAELQALPAFSPDQLEKTTGFFLDLVVQRLLLRALLGEDLKQVRADIEPHIAASVPFFLAACRNQPPGRADGGASTA